MFQLDRVSKHYQGKAALRDLTLSLSANTTTAVIGPSGCGKSTLLRLLVGLIRPDRGSLFFDGEPLTTERLQEARLRIGYVIQEGGLFPHLTAARNVALMARHLGRRGGWDSARIEARIEELATLTRFPPDGLGRYPSALSGGQNQRVALMRALMLDPEVLLLDEPLGALDPMIRYELQKDLKEVFAALAKTVVLVTHDLTEAAFLSSTLVLMRAGGIVQQGSPAELLRAPAEPFVERFVRAQRSHSEIFGADGTDRPRADA